MTDGIRSPAGGRFWGGENMDEQTPATREAMLRYALESYGTEPDCPFAGDMDSLVLRHESSGKWFALLMRVKKSALGLGGEERIDVMNVKVDPALAVSLREREGILPAYHMNKERWVSVLLNGSVPVSLACALMDMSFEGTLGVKRRSKAGRNPDIP